MRVGFDPMSQDYIGCETMDPDPKEFLGKRRYKITCRCLRCGKEYSYVASNVVGPDRPCPKKACVKAALEADFAIREANLRKMLEEQRAPGHIGENVQVKAIDATAEIVMQDHKLTNLKDNIRPGESMAPKLPPQQQKAADNFFSGGPKRMNPKQAELLKRRAVAGAFRGMAINPAQVLPRSSGESPLRIVGTERLK